jgi:hypothetical protein
MAGCPVFLHSHPIPRAGRRQVVVWQLHLGCARYSSHVGLGCTDRSSLRLLQLRYVNGDQGRKAAIRCRADSHRGSRPRVVQRRGFHLTHDASVPVGTAHRALVPAVEPTAWRHVFAGPGLEAGAVVVRRPARPAVAAKKRAGSGIGVSRSGTCGRILGVRQVSIR